MNRVIKPWSKHLGWFEKDSVHPDLRLKSLQMLSWTHDDELIHVSKTIFIENFAAPKNSTNALAEDSGVPAKNDNYMKFHSADLLQVAMNMTMAQGGKEEFELLMEIFDTDPDMAGSCYEAILHVPVEPLVQELIMTSLHVQFAPNLAGFSAILPRFRKVLENTIQGLEAPETAEKIDKGNLLKKAKKSFC